jgi:hypothetical protein
MESVARFVSGLPVVVRAAHVHRTSCRSQSMRPTIGAPSIRPLSASSWHPIGRRESRERCGSGTEVPHYDDAHAHSHGALASIMDSSRRSLHRSLSWRRRAGRERRSTQRMHAAYSCIDLEPPITPAAFLQASLGFAAPLRGMLLLAQPARWNGGRGTNGCRKLIGGRRTALLRRGERQSGRRGIRQQEAGQAGCHGYHAESGWRSEACDARG